MFLSSDESYFDQEEANETLLGVEDENDDYYSDEYQDAGLLEHDSRWKNGVIPFELSLKFTRPRRHQIESVMKGLNSNFSSGCIQFR